MAVPILPALLFATNPAVFLLSRDIYDDDTDNDADYESVEYIS
jgi:hypothetical protein